MSTSSHPKRIAIAGAGITGAYLYQRLRQRGINADIFDVKHTTKCGLHPCAWGTSRGFAEFIEACGLNPKIYILKCSDQVMIDEVRLSADLMTIDKPALLRDLLTGTTVRHTPLEVDHYDRIIDATGVARAFLPPVANDIVLQCRQWRVQTEEVLPNRIQLGSIGYAWCFPLSETNYHIGCGSLTADPMARIQELGWLQIGHPGQAGQILCACAAKIRLTSPQHSQPFVLDNRKNEIWGIGEAIGCVAPLAGDGIVPGMRSVEVLLDNWNDPPGYTAAILNEFKWMEKERSVIDRLRRHKSLGIRSAWVLKRNSRRMGMRVRLRDALTLIGRLK
jgi:flavin-dependent dehydrogenase